MPGGRKWVAIVPSVGATTRLPQRGPVDHGAIARRTFTLSSGFTFVLSEM